jgi:hypothetical protein
VRGSRVAAAGLALLGAAAITPAALAAPVHAGDWEATGAGGAQASFAVVHVIKHVGTGHARHAIGEYVVEDVAVDSPISCADSPDPAPPDDVEVVDGPVALSAHGHFTAGAITGGTGTVVGGRIDGDRAALTYTHSAQSTNAFDDTTETCNTGIQTLTAKPGKRVTVPDGVWHGATHAGEPVTLNVTAAGRALQAPSTPSSSGLPQAADVFGAFTQTCYTGGCTPSSVDVCAYESADALLIAPDGSFSNAQDQNGPDDVSVSGRFTSATRASGDFANDAEGCPSTTWSAQGG